MTTITLSATPKGNSYQATVTLPDGVHISSAETYPSIAEAMTAAAMKLLDMPERLDGLRRRKRPPAVRHPGLAHSPDPAED
jgi:hypothetical protein